MATWIWVIIIIAVAIVVALAATAVARKSRTAALRRQFGPEYDRTLSATEDQQVAEAALRERQRKRAQLDVKPLSSASRTRFAEDWRDIQERFVDSPSEAVASAGALLRDVMVERGYPREDPAVQADLLSVDYPEVIEDYRAADGVRQRAHLGQASTEDLREAVIRYRALFQALLQDEPADSAAADDAAADDAAATGPAASNGASPAPEAAARDRADSEPDRTGEETAMAANRAAGSRAAEEIDEVEGDDDAG
jgi:hypothetical protein